MGRRLPVMTFYTTSGRPAGGRRPPSAASAAPDHNPIYCHTVLSSSPHRILHPKACRELIAQVSIAA
jgi:hypothetical protein